MEYEKWMGEKNPFARQEQEAKEYDREPLYTQREVIEQILANDDLVIKSVGDDNYYRRPLTLDEVLSVLIGGDI